MKEERILSLSNDQNNDEMSVGSLRISRISQLGLLGFFQRVVYVIQAIPLTNPRLINGKMAFISAVNLFEKSLTIPCRSFLTHEIQERSKLMKGQWTNIKTWVKGYERCDSPPHPETLSKIRILLDTYGNIRVGSDLERITKLTHFIEELKKEVSVEILDRLGIYIFVESLEKYRKEYEEFILERKRLASKYKTGDTMKKRKEAIEAYYLFTKLLDVLYVLYPESEEISTLITSINQVIEIEKPKVKVRYC